MSDKPVMGRPTIYNEEIANLICERVATCTFGIRKICATYDDMPTHDTIFKWRYKYKDFSERYAQAKVKQAELLAEEIIDIADDGTNDWMEVRDDQGGVAYKLNGEHVNRSRLRIDTRKWHAAKLAPKIYGDHKKDDDDKPKSEAEQFALRKV